MRISPISFLLAVPARLLTILLITFLVIQLAPGGPVDEMLTRLHEWLIDDGIDRGPIRFETEHAGRNPCHVLAGGGTALAESQRWRADFDSSVAAGSF